MTGGVRDHTFIETLFEFATRVPELVSNMVPTWHLASLAMLDAAFVGRHGIAGLIWDVDGTLTEHHGPLVADAAIAFHGLLALPTLRHVFLSNADERRTRELAGMFPDIAVVRGYRIGEAVVFRRLHHQRESWSDHRDAVAIDAPAIRKPNADLVHEAVRALECEPQTVVMVGDQYLTDIVGANMAGIRSIKVPTLARGSFPLQIQLAQRIEQGVYYARHGRGAGSL